MERLHKSWGCQRSGRLCMSREEGQGLGIRQPRAEGLEKLLGT